MNEMEIIRRCRQLAVTGDPKNVSLRIKRYLQDNGIHAPKYPVMRQTTHPYELSGKYPTVILRDNQLDFDYIVQAFLLKAEEVPVLSNLERLASCATCGGYNGSCPAFSPFIGRFIDNRNLLVLTVTLDYFYVIRRNTKNFAKKIHIYSALTMADKLSEGRGRIMLELVAKEWEGMPLFMGNCPSCQQCSVLTSNKCKKKRKYSMESVGIDCETLHRRLYSSAIPWYFKGTSLLPNYMIRYCGILIRDDVRPEEIVSYIAGNAIDRGLSVSPDFGALEHPDYNLELIDYQMPSYHPGSLQRVYRLRD